MEYLSVISCPERPEEPPTKCKNNDISKCFVYKVNSYAPKKTQRTV